MRRCKLVKRMNNPVNLFLLVAAHGRRMDLDEPRRQGEPILLGVIGKTETISKEDIHEKILHPLMSVLGRVPDRFYVPSEGVSSAYLSVWAEKQDIEMQILEADWRKFQRRAAILRDSRILKESTHLLIFVGTRSKHTEQLGIREAKKGKQVFLAYPEDWSLTQLVVEDA